MVQALTGWNRRRRGRAGERGGGRRDSLVLSLPATPYYLRFRASVGSQSPQPHLEDGSVYRQNRPTKPHSIKHTCLETCPTPIAVFGPLGVVQGFLTPNAQVAELPTFRVQVPRLAYAVALACNPTLHLINFGRGQDALVDKLFWRTTRCSYP